MFAPPVKEVETGEGSPLRDAESPTAERVVMERPGERVEHMGRVVERPGERIERVVEKESWVEKMERVEIPGEKVERVVVERAAGRTGRVENNRQAPVMGPRMVVPNAAPEKSLPPVAAQPPPALVIGKITVEVLQPPPTAVAAAAKNKRPRAARQAVPARRQTSDGPPKLGFGLGQL